MYVEVNPSERGVGYRKLNTSYLKNQEYVKKVRSEIEKTIECTGGKEPTEVWETLKQRIKKASIEFAKGSVSEQKIIIANLSEKVNDFESRLPLTREEDKLWLDTKADLEEKLLEKVRGAMFRSKVRWYKEGERSSKYIFSLEKAKYNAKTCFTLIDDQGNLTEDPQEIIKRQESYYKDLYMEDKDVIFTLENDSGGN